MKVTVTISGLDITKLGAPLHQALLDAVRERAASMPRRRDVPDATLVREFGMPNAPLPRPR